MTERVEISGPSGGRATVDVAPASPLEHLLAMLLVRAARGVGAASAALDHDDAVGSPGGQAPDAPTDVTLERAPEVPVEHDRPADDHPSTADDVPDGAADGAAGAEEIVSELRRMLVGGGFGAALAALLEPVDPDGQDPADLLELVAAWNRVLSWAHARRGHAAAALAAAAANRPDRVPGHSADPHTLAATEIAMRLAISKPSAARMVRTGSLLAGPLTATGQSLEHGALDPAKAETIADALHHVPHQVAWEVEDAVLPGAQGRTPAQLRRDLTRALIAADPHDTELRHRRARDARRVCHPRPLADGMASIYAVLPATDAVALDLALDQAARSAKSAGDTRTHDQIRADALTTTLLTRPVTTTTGAGTASRAGTAPGAAPGRTATTSGRGTGADSTGSASAGPGTTGGAPRVKVKINVTVPLTTLLGGDDPGHLDGYGPIDPATARALAAGGTWRRLVTDPLTGTVLDVGRTRYRPPADLADLVRHRDRTCTRPGCGAAAANCQLDHSLAWSRGGTTASTNLADLCTSDHPLKTEGHYTVTQHPDGTIDWTSRLTGRTYRRHTDGTTEPLNPYLPPPPTTQPPPDPGADPPY